MPAQLTGKQSVLTPHPVFDERVAAFRDNGRSAFSFYYVGRGPDHSWVEDDLVVAAVLCQQDVGEQRRDVGARNELPFLVNKHCPIRVCIPDHSKRGAAFLYQGFGFSPVARQHRIGRTFGKGAVRLKVQRYKIQSQVLGEPVCGSAYKTEVGVCDKRELLDGILIYRLQYVGEIFVQYVAVGARAFLV